MARSSQAACHSFFTVRRVGIVAARRSTALRLTRVRAQHLEVERRAGVARGHRGVRGRAAGAERGRHLGLLPANHSARLWQDPA